MNITEELARRIEKNTEDLANKKILTNLLFEKENRHNILNKETEKLLMAKGLIDKATDFAREKGKNVLEESVSEILKLIFGDSYSIEIELKEKAGSPVANVYIKKNIGLNTEIINLDNEGGGLRDIVSLSFFIAISKLLSDNRAMILLDEPTPAVSESYSEKVAEAIKLLTKYLEKQSIVITHEREYLPNLIDNVYYIEQGKDGVSKAERL
jgi:hypothetical protein PPSC2_p0080